MRFLFGFCALAYVLIYASEGAVRYGLYNVGLDSAILLRDALIIGPVALLLLVQAFRMRVHPAYLVFAAIVALHGAIATLNFGTPLPAIYGAKLLVNILFGFLAASQLTLPSRHVLLLLALVWVASVSGVVLDKFVFSFPWMGLETHVGGIKVDVSRGWDIDSGPDKRAAGFTRSSIAAAMLLPTLALIIAPRIRGLIFRGLVLGVTVWAVYLTTQKGALIAMAAVAGIVCTPPWTRYPLLRIACPVFAVLAVALPLLTQDLRMSTDGGGVFSTASFAMRISLTWPEAWRWITDQGVFPLGVGLGGIGGAQRFYVPDAFNPSDNLFVFLYANFGLLSLVYLGYAAFAGFGVPRHAWRSATPALAILVFNLGYGAALSMLEDQLSSLFIGAAVGTLWHLRQRSRGFVRSDAFDTVEPDGPRFVPGPRAVKPV